MDLDYNNDSKYQHPPLETQLNQGNRGTLFVQQLNTTKPNSGMKNAEPKNSFYLEIDEDNQSENSDDFDTSGCSSLDPIYCSISSMSAKNSWIINEAFESDPEDVSETGSGYTTPEKRVSPPFLRRSTVNVSYSKIEEFIEN